MRRNMHCATRRPCGCQLCNNRKCGNENKCLHTQEDTGREKTDAKPDRASTAPASWELGERVMLVERLGDPRGTVPVAEQEVAWTPEMKSWIPTTMATGQRL